MNKSLIILVAALILSSCDRIEAAFQKADQSPQYDAVDDEPIPNVSANIAKSTANDFNTLSGNWEYVVPESKYRSNWIMLDFYLLKGKQVTGLEYAASQRSGDTSATHITLSVICDNKSYGINLFTKPDIIPHDKLPLDITKMGFIPVLRRMPDESGGQSANFEFSMNAERYGGLMQEIVETMAGVSEFTVDTIRFTYNDDTVISETAKTCEQLYRYL